MYEWAIANTGTVVCHSLQATMNIAWRVNQSTFSALDNFESCGTSKQHPTAVEIARANPGNQASRQKLLRLSQKWVPATVNLHDSALENPGVHELMVLIPDSRWYMMIHWYTLLCHKHVPSFKAYSTVLRYSATQLTSILWGFRTKHVYSGGNRKTRAIINITNKRKE